MPTFYNYTEGGQTIALDDVFVPPDAFRQGNLWNWGRNAYGQLGNNNTTQSNTPVTTLSGGANWKQVANGTSYTTAIKTDGTLWGWGGNFFGNLGINNTTDRPTPVTTFAGGTNWKQVSCGDNNTAAIKTDGTLWTWGANFFGALGTNDATGSNHRTTPVTTFAGGTNWKQVNCGLYHTSAIKTDGTLWNWGRNGEGQLGVNDTNNRCTPVTTFLGGNNWKQVSAGALYTAAIKTDGTLWTWGRNVEGQLGVNDTTQRNTPVTTFAGGTNWKQVAGVYICTAAIKTDGTLWTWGSNSDGQLGINVAGATTGRTTPVTTFVGGTNWKQVGGGYYHTSAIKTDGTLWNWGKNNFGQLGVNDTNTRCTPVTTFIGGIAWKQVSGIVGLSSHTAAVTYIDDYQ
jgi:alpha-tubulin suppressor-like RCC1 family protein